MRNDASVRAALRSRSVFTILVTLVGCAGALTPFLTFVENSSPLSVIQERLSGNHDFFGVGEYAPIAVPFFLAPIFAIAVTRWVASGGLSRGERAGAWALAGASAASAFGFFVRSLLSGELHNTPVADVIGVMLLWLLPAAGFGLALWLRPRTGTSLGALAAMEMVYVGNALVCLYSFHELQYRSGAYCTMVAAAAMCIHATVITAAAVRSRSAAAQRMIPGS